MLDGFPLAKKGEAARALSAAFVSSLFGGILGAIVLTFFILIARPLILAFGTPEMLMITLLGLIDGCDPCRTRPAEGRCRGRALALMVGTIGDSDASGSLRMASYSIPYLTDGIKLVIVGLGIFAVPEIVSLLRQDRAISRTGGLGAGWLQGIRDWWANIWLSVRSAFIGVLVGVIPGLGGSVVDWIAYGFTVQSAKDKSQFGKGDIRGVIGPESSNNAKEGGGLVPTLIFGIPGSGSMAVFSGACAFGLRSRAAHGAATTLTSPTRLSGRWPWQTSLAQAFAFCFRAQIAKITTIRFTLVAPFLFMLIAFAAFQSSQSLADLAMLLMIGCLGIFLRRFEWSRPAFLIGFVLSSQAESFANQAVQISRIQFRRDFWQGMEYIFSPVTIGILILLVISVVIGVTSGQTDFGR